MKIHLYTLKYTQNTPFLRYLNACNRINYIWKGVKVYKNCTLFTYLLSYPFSFQRVFSLPPTSLFAIINTLIRYHHRFFSLTSSLLFANANTSVRYRLKFYKLLSFGRDRTTKTVEGFFHRVQRWWWERTKVIAVFFGQITGFDYFCDVLCSECSDN